MPRRKAEDRRIHPIIVYPFSHPGDTSHLAALYDFVNARVHQSPHKYCRPITVMNRQTFINNQKSRAFQALLATAGQVSDLEYTWSVDTCQMWLAGFGLAYDRAAAQGRANDVFWLVPGDFFYDSAPGRKVLAKLESLPDHVRDDGFELCLGEIKVDPNSAKQLIDTYGTYGLLYNWFPHEAQVIRTLTDKPRSEFFAIGSHYLKLALHSRWYAYEQTLIILLHGTHGGRIPPNLKICREELGSIEDDPQGRQFLAHAMQQVERTERVLKQHWREMNAHHADWPLTFRRLDAQSEDIRGAAMVIFEQVLK